MKKFKVCIIGGGAAGLSALKIIRDSPAYKRGSWEIVAYEARHGVGGVWLPAPPIDDPPLTPMYDSLTTNLPHPIMAFPSLVFPIETPLFPRAEAVLEYLRLYAKQFDLMQHVRLNTTVTSVRWTGAQWTVKTSINDSGEEEFFDHLIVANGHYRVPYIPPLPGLDSWVKAGRVTHSAWYRSPHYVGDNVLVVGAGPSGQDLSDEMQSVSKVLIHSIPGSTPQERGNLKVRGRVVGFSESDHSVIFDDGTLEHNIDHVFLATGYLTSFPFFSNGQLVPSVPPPVPPMPSKLYNSSQHVFPLARDLFPLSVDVPAHAVAFMGLPIKVVPFPLFEAQARAIVKLFDEPESLDIPLEVTAAIERYEFLRDEVTAGDGRVEDVEMQIAHAWPRYRGQEQFNYRDALHEFAGYSGRVYDWEKKFYDAKVSLRQTWRALETSGEAADWVRGVGSGGIEDWLDLMERLLQVQQSRQVEQTIFKEADLHV